MNNEEKILSILETMQGQIGSMQGQIGSMQDRLDSMESEIAKNSAEIAQVRTEVAQNRTEITQVRTEVAQNRTEITQVRTEVAQTRTEIMAYIETHVEKKLDLALEGTMANREAIDRVKMEVDDLHEDVTAHTLYILRDINTSSPAKTE